MDKKLLVDDLINLGESIYTQDCLIKATNERRVLNVKLLVSDISIWNKQKKLLIELINFMSHDYLNIEFEEKKKQLDMQQHFNTNSTRFNASTLLSGGLDSLCGVDYNIKNNINSVYCSYKINTYETKPIRKLGEYLKKNYSANHYIFDKINIRKKEHTQRTRSFYFICLACRCAFENDVSIVKLYENGVMSLNPGLTSRTPTRTTHPKTIKLINQLLKNLNLNIMIEHPFLFMTKGEMVNNLSDEFKNLIKMTNTCGMSRQNKKLKLKTGHCGACVPCLLRKISMAAYDNERYDSEYDMTYDSTIGNSKELYPHLKSSYAYYHEFYDKIKQGNILNELDINHKYYDDQEYLIKTKEMLDKFAKELEIFFGKYPI